MFFAALVIVFALFVWARLRAYEPAASAATAPIAYDADVAPEERASGDSLPPLTGVLLDSGASPQIIDARPPTPREERYEELLRAAPVAEPGRSARGPSAGSERASEPSFFERITAPIAAAFGAGKEPQAAARQRQPGAEPPVLPPKRSSEPQRPHEDIDPESDVVPPQLIAADFTPPQVHDGESTLFAILVNDNLSGVRSVTGVISSPTGSVQGFASQREGETNRFFARINVPREAPEGVWAVKYLTLTDNAGNTINLTEAQSGLPPSARFRVTSSSPDAMAPTLEAMWLEKPAMRAGERNRVFVQAEDDKSGVALVSGVLVSPTRQARIGFGCRRASTGWECPLNPPACLDCGLWRVEQIQLQDKANNNATFRADNEIVRAVQVDISADRCDGTAPTITAVLLDPLVVSNADGGTVRVALTASDDVCGIANLSGQATPAGGSVGQRAYFSFEPAGDGQTFIGRIAVQKHAARGEWVISWIQALDKGHNLRAYSANDPVLARATFRVE